MTNFKVGQKVVCVDDSLFYEDIPHPIKGKKYTIESFYSCPSCGVSSISVSEIVGFCSRQQCTACNISQQSNNNPIRESFRCSRFRPLTYASATSEILAKFPLTEEKADVEIKEHQPINK